MAYIVKSVIIYFKNINISFRSVNFWPQRKQVCFLKQTPDFPRGSRGEQRYWRSVMYHGQDIFCFKNGQETVIGQLQLYLYQGKVNVAVLFIQ